MNPSLDGMFVYSLCPQLSWREVLYGLECKFIDEHNVMVYAFERLNEKSSDQEIRLAVLEKNETYLAFDCLNRLSSDDRVKRPLATVWIYLYLCYFFQNRDTYPDPFLKIDELYATFDYPEDLAPLIRYMPLPEGQLGGEEYLYKNWQTLMEFYSDLLSE